MNGPALLLCLLSFCLLGLLPIVFFQRGRMTRSWVITSLPFLTDAVLLLLALLRVIEPLPAPAAFAYLAVPFIAAAFLLIGLTLGTHTRPVALWHQHADAPVSIVQHGAYSRIRHPFYASFILMLAGTVLALPHPATLALLVVGALQLNVTAAREERRLLASDLGAEYARYMERAGRFVPRRGRQGTRNPIPLMAQTPHGSAPSSPVNSGGAQGAKPHPPLKTTPATAGAPAR